MSQADTEAAEAILKGMSAGGKTSGKKLQQRVRDDKAGNTMPQADTEATVAILKGMSVGGKTIQENIKNHKAGIITFPGPSSY